MITKTIIKNLLPTQVIDAVIFDCDSTLTRVEGIDELARFRDVEAEVAELTRRAMDEGIMGEALYRRRLDLVTPTKAQVDAIGRLYCEQVVPDALEVIALLHALGKPVYIVSAGLYPAVMAMARYLQVDPARVYAVNILFDDKGAYCDFDVTSPLIHIEGKITIAQQLRQQHPHVVMIGDGMNDARVRPVVDKFIGYGGVCYRENILALSDVYIKTLPLRAVLPLCLTDAECTQLPSWGQQLVAEGVALLETDGEVFIPRAVTN